MDVQQPEPGKKPSLTATAYEALRQEIVSCALLPGSDINEAELAQRLDMSKTPIREALLRLRNDGFIETFPRRGYRVLPVTLNDLNELIEARIALESGVAALAAQRITDAQLAEMERLTEATYDKNSPLTLPAFISANRDFHSAIARASGNARLARMISANLAELERFFYLGAMIRDVAVETNSDHHAILEVLRRRDPRAAHDVIVAHNNATRAGLLESLTSSNMARMINLI